MAARDDVQRRYVSKDEGQSFAIGTEPVQYYRVSEGSAGVAAIAPSNAQAAGASVRELQKHTVPRVVSNGCKGLLSPSGRRGTPAAAVAAPIRPIAKLNLSG